jgi:iron-sulfur cluster assembly protein
LIVCLFVCLLMQTKEAADEMLQLLEEHASSSPETPVHGIRIGVNSSGCSGLTYTMGYAEEVGDDDTVVEENGVRVVVESAAEVFLVGTEIDHVSDELCSEFVFRNPNARESCGCGQSFSI